jgi:hypothetical protein
MDHQLRHLQAPRRVAGAHDGDEREGHQGLHCVGVASRVDTKADVYSFALVLLGGFIVQIVHSTKIFTLSILINFISQCSAILAVPLPDLSQPEALEGTPKFFEC